MSDTDVLMVGKSLLPPDGASFRIFPFSLGVCFEETVVVVGCTEACDRRLWCMSAHTNTGMLIHYCLSRTKDFPE